MCVCVYAYMCARACVRVSVCLKCALSYKCMCVYNNVCVSGRNLLIRSSRGNRRSGSLIWLGRSHDVHHRFSRDEIPLPAT